MKKSKPKAKKNKSGLKGWGLALLLVLIFALLIKGFVIQSFIVASPKMEKTLMTGDVLLVNKISIGARMPITLFSVPFFPSVYYNLIQFPPARIPAKNQIKQNELLVFNYPTQDSLPIDKRETMVKRCVGLPGDTFKIIDKRVYVNNLLFNESQNMQFNYRLETHGKFLNQKFIDKYGINEGGLVSEKGTYDFPLTHEMLKQIATEKNVNVVGELKDLQGKNLKMIFPYDKFHSYNKDYFGPLVVPFKGQKVKLSTSNIEIYRYLIVVHESNKLEIKNEKIFINGIETSTYLIKENYYFVLDDNRDNAKDSRYWGFLPESHIIGKATFLWFSYDKNKGKIRWNRIFKTLKNEV